MHYKNKKVLILGLGLNDGGVGAARFFAKTGAQVRVTDLKTEKILKPSLEKLSEFEKFEYILGEHRFEDIDWADLVIRNQAIKPGNEYLQYAKRAGKEIQTDVGIFLEFVSPKQIIGVTGTKGKSTTSSLIYTAIKSKYPNSILAGNIGRSTLDSLEKIDKDTLVVLEISSFQLEAFDEKKVSPHVAVITNIYPDHLNYYSSMDDYIVAKKIIAKYQTDKDILFINSENEVINSPEFLEGLKGKTIKFSKNDLPEGFKPKLKGEHNLENYAAAYVAAKALEIPEEEVLEGLEGFEGVEFRMQLIKNFEGIKIFNDTAATTPDACIAALKSFNNAILICGGMNKGLKYEDLASQIDRSAKAVYFLEGDATDELRKFIQHRNILRSNYDDLTKLLKDVKLEAKRGDIILFSPGATSFNLFQNEFDRGRKFNQAVDRVFG